MYIDVKWIGDSAKTTVGTSFWYVKQLGYRVRVMVSPAKSYYLGINTCRKISAMAQHCMQQHIITESLVLGGKISHT